jgi:septation ring formation regulator EzrA
MELKNPILDIEMTEENKEELTSLKNGFEELDAEEKLDVIDFQNIMLQKVSKHREMYGIPDSKQAPKRDADEIISHMTPKSLDYSQMCINYCVSKISSTIKK